MAKEKPNLPETPFDGIIIARDVSLSGYGSSSSSTLVHLAIKHEADEKAEKPRIFFHHFAAYHGYLCPRLMLRRGHRVRVKSVSAQEGYLVANEITFDPAILEQNEEQ